MEMREVGKKELIISSTKKMILEKGYRNTSVEDITNCAGISKGSFYTYFKSKNLVIDHILEETINKLKIETAIDRRVSLVNNVKKLVRNRIILEDENLKDNLVMINLFRNIALLDERTLALLKEIEGLIVGKMRCIIKAYSKEIKIDDEEVDFYSKMLSSIITNYKTFTLFISERDGNFIKNIEEIKDKYNSKEFEKNIEIISESILKILTY
ncbi:TetR/AcrR family transcriptional regulator [Fusobacterium sp.]|uniref:TetR/AcrR family transcriptional regulator n=1 Tax=Fusobacterium sp. TaxID=68766 RepID=UPI00345ABDA7